MQKWLILGASGQLGSDLAQLWQTNGQVEAITPVRAAYDFEREQQLENYLARLDSCEGVVNCSAWTDTKSCEADVEKSYRINTFPLLTLARFCHRRKIPLLHISTDYVFDGEKGAPYLETDPVRPVNIYGLSKLAAENIVYSYASRFSILRVASLFGVQGASGKGGNFVEFMLNKAKNGEEIKVVDDQFVAPTHTLDIARYIDVLIRKEKFDNQITHVSSSGICSWYEFTQTILELCRIRANVQAVKTADFPSAIRRPMFSVLDNTKMSALASPPMWQGALQEYLQLKGYLA